jgi:hypothetical protein
LHAEAINPDGARYISMARQWPQQAAQVIKSEDYHLGYPVVIHWVHQTMTLFGAGDGPVSWEHAGQTVSLIAAIIATVAIWVFAGISCNWRIAGLTVIMLAAARKWSILGAEVMSDSLAVACQMWALVLTLMVLNRLRQRQRTSVMLAGAVGLVAGMGYLVRPESLGVLMIATAVWIVFLARERFNRQMTAGCIGLAGIGALAMAAPYMYAIGGLTKKKRIGDIVPVELNAMPLHLHFAGPAAEFGSIRALLNQLTEAMHPVLFFIVFLWLVRRITLIVQGHAATAADANIPNRAGGTVMLAGAFLLSTVAIGLHSNVNYLDYRHVTLLGMILAPLAGAGLVAASAIADRKLARFGAAQVRVLKCLAFGAIMLALLAHTLRPLPPGKGFYKTAGQYLATINQPGDYVLASHPWVLYYAQADGQRIEENASADDLMSRLRQIGPAPKFVVLSDAFVAGNSALGAIAQSPLLTEVNSFAQEVSRNPDRIRIYRVNRENSDRS